MIHPVFTRFLPILTLSIGIFCSAFSQEKIENERRIKSSEVPDEAKSWLKDAFEAVKKPKWFLEYSQRGKSYEAKFKYEGHYHSVEFDSLGNVEDVEIEISQSDVGVEVWNEIQSYYDATFVAVKVEKVQRQLTGSKSDLEDFFDDGKVEGIVFRFELVFQGKNEHWELWEAIFDDSGKLLSLLKVQILPNNNLVF